MWPPARPRPNRAAHPSRRCSCGARPLMTGRDCAQSPQLTSLFARQVLHLTDDIVIVEPAGGGFVEEALHEGTKFGVTTASWTYGWLRRGDEGADTSSRLEHAGSLELGVHTRDGVGI